MLKWIFQLKELSVAENFFFIRLARRELTLMER